jgi:hypothetical protein
MQTSLICGQLASFLATLRTVTISSDSLLRRSSPISEVGSYAVVTQVVIVLMTVMVMVLGLGCYFRVHVCLALFVCIDCSAIQHCS